MKLLRAIAESLRGGHHDYTAGSLSRAIVLLSVPMVLEMAMESLFVVVDIFWVAHLGEKAVSAVGITEAMFAIVFAAAMGLSAAATATVARRIGEKNPDAASHAGAQSIILGVIVSLAFAIPGYIYGGELLAWMSGSRELAEYGGSFTTIMLAGTPGVMLLFLNNAIFRGAGNATIAMHALWLANSFNMILDPVFIFGWGPVPAMGVAGAAVATTVGRSIGALYGFWRLYEGRGELRLRLRHFSWDVPLMTQLVGIAAPAGFQYLVPTASWLGLMRIVAVFGGAATAGYTIAIRIIVFVLLPAWGLSNAAATLVGQNLGAKQPERAEKSVLACGLYNMAFLVTVSIGLILFAEPLVRVFTQDGPVVEVAVQCLRILSYGYGFYAWGMVLIQAFNGAGDTRIPTVVNFVCYWLFQLPLAYAWAHWWGGGVAGVFWAVPMAEFLLAAIAYVLFRRGSWKSTVV
jgi:putative MATE family efflux protein